MESCPENGLNSCSHKDHHPSRPCSKGLPSTQLSEIRKLPFAGLWPTQIHMQSTLITSRWASAGAVTTIALGISNLEDFRDEISTDDDPTLTTHLDETYDVRSMVYFWGSTAKWTCLKPSMVWSSMRDMIAMTQNSLGHGTAPDPVTPYDEALELQEIYELIGVHSELKTLCQW